MPRSSRRLTSSGMGISISYPRRLSWMGDFLTRRTQNHYGIMRGELTTTLPKHIGSGSDRWNRSRCIGGLQLLLSVPLAPISARASSTESYQLRQRLMRRADPTEVTSSCRKKQTNPASDSTPAPDRTAEVPLGPQARAKAAADVGIGNKSWRRFSTSAPTASRFQRVSSPVNRGAQSPGTVSCAPTHDDFSGAVEARLREIPTSSSALTLPVIGSVTPQLALVQEEDGSSAAAGISAPARNTKGA
ncbi:MAG: hypothetical protein J3Q66DRAFT_157397 [Benniella sp.]|nr:MAG: hypothetical protein J3Q66DRAFT_157397 [Benniella sp.]